MKRYFGGVSIRQIDKMTNSVANVLKIAEKYLAEMQETGSTRQKTRNNTARLKHKEHKPAVIDCELAA